MGLGKTVGSLKCDNIRGIDLDKIDPMHMFLGLSVEVRKNAVRRFTIEKGIDLTGGTFSFFF